MDARLIRDAPGTSRLGDTGSLALGGALGDDLSHELVAGYHGGLDGALRPPVPLVDVEIGAADGGPLHFDQYVVDAQFRVRHFLQPEAFTGLLLDQRFHGVLVR